jgi:hypothetical protein
MHHLQLPSGTYPLGQQLIDNHAAGHDRPGENPYITAVKPVLAPEEGAGMAAIADGDVSTETPWALAIDDALVRPTLGLRP